MFNQILRIPTRSAFHKITRKLHFFSKELKTAHFDEAPVPRGCYEIEYKKKQMIYYRQFILGSISLFSAWGVVYQNEELLWNFNPIKELPDA